MTAPSTLTPTDTLRKMRGAGVDECLVGWTDSFIRDRRVIMSVDGQDGQIHTGVFSVNSAGHLSGRERPHASKGSVGPPIVPVRAAIVGQTPGQRRPRGDLGKRGGGRGPKAQGSVRNQARGVSGAPGLE